MRSKLRTAAQWMENEAGLSWEEALKIAREVHDNLVHDGLESILLNHVYRTGAHDRRG